MLCGKAACQTKANRNSLPALFELGNHGDIPDQDRDWQAEDI
jgi:hypothetical protein